MSASSSGEIAVQIRCAGCGQDVPWGPGVPLPFVCPRAGDGDGADHLLLRQIAGRPGEALAAEETEASFLRHRHRLSSLHLARAGGLGESWWRGACEALDARIAEIDGAGFRRTPLLALGDLGLGPRAGRVYAKLDAANVSGSHKARHLMGVMLSLLVRERLGGGGRPALAIASCGNAALAAAVVARAARWPIEVFVPPDAEAPVMGRLDELGARVRVCDRRPGEAGDPCVLRFREAVAAGALPFCCQGTDCGLTIEGGETLGYELIEQIVEAGGGLDRLIVQVGGGALASALVAACAHAVAVGALPGMPRLHAVQTAGGYPLARAWARAVEAVEEGAAASGERMPGVEGGPGARAAWIAARLRSPAVRAVRARMRRDRGAFMWPWESPPRSVAHGILDDETYDWRVIVDAMLASGGFPLVVGDGAILGATALADARSPLPVSPTGAAGVAGLLALADGGEDLSGQRSAVILSGVARPA